MTDPSRPDPFGARLGAGFGEFWIGDGPDLSPPPSPDGDRWVTLLVVALVVVALGLALLTAS